LILQKVKYYTREALHNLWQFKTRHFFSLTIIGLSFVIIGVFLSLSNNLRFRAGELSKNLTVVFYLHKNVTASERGLIEDEVRRSPLVAAVRAVGPEEASDKFVKDFPELKDILLNLNGSPFPASIEASLKDPGLSTEKILQFITEVRKNASVEDVQFNRDWADKIRSLGRLAEAVGLFLGGILVLASFFIISNVIKLNVLARKSEIEILRFVGATNTFIRIPFFLEGVMLGVAGSVLSLLIVFILIKIFPFYLGSSLGALKEIVGFRYLTPAQALALVFGGGSVGFLGGLSSLARFLRI
jgi:cell division transport system permease protein